MSISKRRGDSYLGYSKNVITNSMEVSDNVEIFLIRVYTFLKLYFINLLFIITQHQIKLYYLYFQEDTVFFYLIVPLLFLPFYKLPSGMVFNSTALYLRCFHVIASPFQPHLQYSYLIVSLII